MLVTGIYSSQSIDSMPREYPSSHRPDPRKDFATLWAESFDRLRTYVRIFVPNPHDADDVIQETAAAIAKDFDKYDNHRPFLEWAVGIARNRVLQHFRKRDRDHRMVFDLETVKHIEASILTLEPDLSGRQEALERCLEVLPARSRQLIQLKYASNMKAEEIAEQLDLTVHSVYTRLSQLRSSLRDCISRRLRQAGEAAT